MGTGGGDVSVLITATEAITSGDTARTDDTASAIKTMPVDDAGDYKAPYAFSIGGVNFDDYTLIKTLWLPGGCNDTSQVTFKCGATSYQVPSTHAFIALRATAYILHAQILGRVGEASSDGGDIEQEVLSLGVGTANTFMVDVLGVFSAGSWIVGATNHQSTNMNACAIYGVEVPI